MEIVLGRFQSSHPQIDEMLWGHRAIHHIFLALLVHKCVVCLSMVDWFVTFVSISVFSVEGSLVHSLAHSLQQLDPLAGGLASSLSIAISDAPPTPS